MAEYLTMGLVLGLSAGLAPRPMLTLVISETLRHGLGSGIRIAIAPLFSDLPIIVLAVWVLSQLSNFEFILGCLSLMGGVVVFYMGIESLKSQIGELSDRPGEARSLTKGILTNLLNPHPYVFWITVGIPFMLKTWASGPMGAMLWLLVFYLMLVGSKIGLAVMVGRSRQWIHGAGYVWLNRILGVLLLFFAVKLAFDGVILLKMPPHGVS